MERNSTMKKTIRNGWGGFTLIELLVVIAIIAILSVGMLKVAQNVRLKAQTRNTQGTIRLLCDALQEYFDYKGYFPGDSEHSDSGINDIIGAYNVLNDLPQSEKILSKLSGEYVERRVDNNVYIVDAWVRDGEKLELRYENPGNGNFPIITSAGPDGQPDTADDIISSEF